MSTPTQQVFISGIRKISLSNENEWESSVLFTLFLTFSWVEIQRDEKFYFKILKGSKSNLLRGSWDIKTFINAILK